VSLQEVTDQVGYPHARWRLAPERLNTVLVRFQQIAIRFAPPGRTNEDKIRSVDQARERAIRIADDVRRDPSSFEAVARAVSEDARTAPFGGACGTLRATMIDPATLDALSELPVGATSRPFVENERFLVIRRLAVPPDERVAASRIVVKFSGCAGAPRQGRDVSRSKDAARAVARDAAERAKRAPDEFARLVETYSDEYDIGGGGDIGAWPLYNGGSWAPLFEILSTLPVGGVSDPVETDEGYVVLRRTDKTTRERIAASQVVVSYAGAPEPPDGRVVTRSKDDARSLAARIVADLVASPRRFGELRDRYCDQPGCDGPPQAWELGHNYASIERALSSVARGEIVRYVVETPLGFHVLRREDESGIAEGPHERFEFEIPRPEFRDLSFVLSHAPGATLADETRKLAVSVGSAMHLPKEQSDALRRELDGLAVALLRESPDARLEAYQRTGGRVRQILGQPGYDRFQEYVTQWLQRAQLQ
jgi:hypothetical protein